MKNQKLEDAKDVQETKGGKFVAGCVSIIMGILCIGGIIWGLSKLI